MAEESAEVPQQGAEDTKALAEPSQASKVAQASVEEKKNTQPPTSKRGMLRRALFGLPVIGVLLAGLRGEDQKLAPAVVVTPDSQTATAPLESPALVNEVTPLAPTPLPPRPTSSGQGTVPRLEDLQPTARVEVNTPTEEEKPQ